MKHYSWDEGLGKTEAFPEWMHYNLRFEMLTVRYTDGTCVQYSGVPAAQAESFMNPKNPHRNRDFLQLRSQYTVVG
jgi:hypothetical protein